MILFPPLPKNEPFSYLCRPSKPSHFRAYWTSGAGYCKADLLRVPLVSLVGLFDSRVSGGVTRICNKCTWEPGSLWPHCYSQEHGMHYCGRCGAELRVAPEEVAYYYEDDYEDDYDDYLYWGLYSKALAFYTSGDCSAFWPNDDTRKTWRRGLR